MPGFLSKLFNKNAYVETPEGRLIAAAEAGRLWRVRRLLKQGVDVNGKNRGCRTALSVAAAKGQDRVVAALLKAGADTEAGHDFIGHTALGLAAQAGHLKVVQRLIAAGADLDTAGGTDRTPLHNALFYQHADVAAALLDAGAAISTPGASEGSLLLTAITFSPSALSIRLIEQGADLAPRDGMGYTARELAQACDYPDIVAAIDARLEREAAARAEKEASLARDAAAKESALASASTLQRPMAVGKPLALKK